MAEEFQTVSTSAPKNTSLTQGLARNTFFNLIGWVWPIGLAMLSVPYIVKKMGNDAFGVFSIVSILAGYLSMLNLPVAMGNVRFMAESYANEAWSELRRTALAGIVINGVLSLLGALIMFFAAGVLARNIFHVPSILIGVSVAAFRLAALSFFLNGIVGALISIPSAMRRFDIRNQVGLVVGTLNTVAIVLALSFGWGLLGAVLAQVFSSVLGLFLFSLVVWQLFRKLPSSGHSSLVTASFVKRLASFSSLLFAGQVTSLIGLQIDRTLVGIMLNTSAVTYYTVPTRITDRIPGLMSVLNAALYPLSSEAKATGKLDELRHLYHEMIRILFLISSFIAAPLMILSKDFLALWIGSEYKLNSWLVLALLAAGVVWRSPGSVAYQITNGMGRADINLIASIGTAVFVAIPVLIMTSKWGTTGAALGVFIGLFISNLGYTLFAQKKLLGGIKWRESLSPYVQIVLAEAGTIGFAYFLPGSVTGWFSLIGRAGLILLIYAMLSLAIGFLRIRDIKFIMAKTLRFFKPASSSFVSGH
jgi:O-antigen/teichoic acid export membrane protein